MVRSLLRTDHNKKVKPPVSYVPVSDETVFKKIHFILAYAETIKPFQSHLRHFFAIFLKLFTTQTNVFYNTKLPFSTQSFEMFHMKKEGSKQTNCWVFSGKCLQDKYQKYNFIGEDFKSKCAKTWKLVRNVKRFSKGVIYLLCCICTPYLFSVLRNRSCI